MKKTRVTFKSIFSYISTIITWSIFVILISCVLVLVYYYISIRIYATKGEKYAPKFSIYTIVSPSMVPKIKVYDVIVNFKVDSPTDIKVGDVITFKSTSSMTYGMTITHRVKDIQIVNGEYEYITKGDNNAIADLAPAQYSNVIGRATIKIPQLGRVQFFVASKFGWLMVVILPALYVIGKDVIKLIRISKTKNRAAKVNAELLASQENKTESDENRKALS